MLKGMLLISFAVLLAVTTATAQEAPPADFPHFQFAGHDEQAQLLGNYLWYHFHKRLGNNPVLFNKEYLLISDAWLGGATDEARKKSIQEVHREDLLAIEIDAEGYVNTHQHFSHAYDRGWPFPLWPQSGAPGRITAGWHFQPLDKVPFWVGDQLRHAKLPEYCGEEAAGRWQLENAKSLGILDNHWRVEATGPSPRLTTPEGYTIDAFNAPFLQLRWKRTGEAKAHTLPYVEWLCEGDTVFGPDRRFYFEAETTPLSSNGQFHSILAMHRHPKWQGKITRIRITPAPGESDVTFYIDSFFSVYDTRHTINNPLFVLGSRYYFNWTGDVDFLRKNINRMRTALRYQQTEMGGLKYNRIRNPWPGHDGLPGYTKDAKGKVTLHPGHGIGNNYWDIMPFGGDDFYATYQYYAATLALADLEEAIRRNPGWGAPTGAWAMDPQWLRDHAAAVKEEANRFFWSADRGRFVACVDTAGNQHDYGFTFLNLDAIWYGIASDEHARSIMDWISGKRIVEGDTSTGADIYHWRFGPRATTRRNLDWYGQGWTAPESIPWGGQVQDGGAVLGFTFYDLWARLHVLGPEDAWQRLSEILAWDKEVQAGGGYRAYYADGKQGTTLQGGGTAGGLGIDAEFYESSLLPSIVTYGFLGLEPRPEALAIHPKLPASCPSMALTNFQYHGALMDVNVSGDAIEFTLKSEPTTALRLEAPEGWVPDAGQSAGAASEIVQAGAYRFVRK